MKNERRMKWVLISAILIVCGVASAAIEIPKASGKALGVTRGKKFDAGLVFVDGRYLEPPYVVERWGVGIRINGTPVVGQVIEWTEFLKTQEGVKVTKAESVTAAQPEPEPEPEVEEEDDSDTSLDDLFDDDPKPKKTVKKVKKASKPRPPKPTLTLSYSLEGEFVQNDVSKALLAKINKTRTDINAILLAGGFICFGEKYSRVSSQDARIANAILENLPEIEKSARSESDVIAGVRSASLYYLTEPICRDLYRNRIDYLKLQARRDRQRKQNSALDYLGGAGGSSRR